MKLKQSILAAAMLVAAAVPMQAQAAVATGTLQVSATVVAPTASVTTAGGLAFGTTLKGGTATGTTTFDVTASNGTPYTIALTGLHDTNSSYQLVHSNGRTFAGYTLFESSAKSVSYLPTATKNKTGSGVAQTYTLYGEWVISPTSVSGSFTDTVTVTVTY